MFLPVIPPVNIIKPNRIETPENKKDKRYHLNYGMYALGTMNHPAHRIFLIKTLVNWNFYQNNQWIFEEDLEAFLKDESGDVRNRIRIVYNMIQPMVQQYIGQAIRMDFDAKAVSVSDFVINRREKELERLKFFTKMANEIPALAGMIKESMPIGKNEAETEGIFENVYVDHYERNLNNLMAYVAEKNNFDQNKMEVAKHIALSGLGVHKGYEWNGEHTWEVLDPLYFFFDYGAKRKDLKDADYMGEVKYMSPVEIFERFQDIDKDERIRIERYVQQFPSANRFLFHYIYGETSGRVPVFEVYWKDTQVQEYGYVIDDFGYEYLTRINYEGGEYTDKDLIVPKEENHVKFLGKGNKKKKMYVDVMRYVIFCPAIMIGGNEDIALEWGVMPYQETYALDPSNVEFPYKCGAWDYHNGLILSPVDAVIDPQRLSNRMLSIAESRINNSRGSGSVIDKSAIDPQGGEEEVMRNINQNKPIFVDSRGRGVQNVVGNYGSTIGSDTEFVYEMAERMRGIIQNISGVNEMMTGTAGGKQKLVGVAQMELQRGSLLQENFYYTLSQIMLQSYQCIASSGKRIYAESKRRLSIIVGDVGAEEIIITKDMNLEDFRVFVKRVMPDDAQKEAANGLLMQLRGAGMIEEAEFANFFGRANMEDVATAIRESYKRRQMAAAKAEEMGAQQQQVAQMQQQLAIEQLQAKEDRFMQREAEQDLSDKEFELDKIKARTIGQIERDRQKNKSKV